MSLKQLQLPLQNTLKSKAENKSHCMLLSMKACKTGKTQCSKEQQGTQIAVLSFQEWEQQKGYSKEKLKVFLFLGGEGEWHEYLHRFP